MDSNIDLKFFEQCKSYFIYHAERNIPYTRGFGEGRPVRSRSEYLEYQVPELTGAAFDDIKKKVETHLKAEDPKLTYGIFRVAVEKKGKGYGIAVGYYAI